MLNKVNRLTKDKDFDSAFKKGRSSYDKITGVKVILNNLETNRFGILVSTKINKKAVERNRVKRRIREVIRLRLDNIKNGYDFVIISLPGIIDKKYEDIEKSIDNHLKKLKLYK